MPGIDLRKRIGPDRHIIAGKDLGQRGPVGLGYAQFGGQIGVVPDEARRADGHGGLTGEEPGRQRGVAVVEGYVHVHAQDVISTGGGVYISRIIST